MLVMQGFFDDSGSSQHQKMFVLAGFVSWSNNWAEFSDEWDRELKADPAIEQFKWNEAAILSKNFKGWKRENAQAKKLRLANIAKTYSMVRVRTQIEWSDFLRYQDQARQHWPKTKRLPEILDSPYFLLFFNTVLCVAQYRLQYRWDMQLDYIFDEQSRFGSDAMRYWDIAVRLMPDALKPYAGERPIHRSDKTFLPLQAADMYAGACRAALLAPADPVDEVLTVLGQVPGTGRIVDLRVLDEAVETMVNNPGLRKAIAGLGR